MRKTSIGGEALIEGVMMRGPENIAIAIRKPDGEIIVEKKPVKPLARRHKFFKLPLVRGAVGIFESMIIGMRSLMYSAEFVDLEDEKPTEPSRFEKFIEKLFGDKLFDVIIYASVIFALVFGVAVFMLLPNIIAGFMHFNKESVSGLIFYNLFEGLIRIVLFVSYIALVSKVKDIHRVFQYHGAEHKTIHCYENEEDLTVANVKKYTTLHPRCGTAFLFVVMIVSILVFSFIGWYSAVVNVLLRVILMPLVAGLSYELIKFSGRSTWKIVALVNVPGLALQRFTTKEPDESQIEVAIEALKNVLVEDKDADKW